MAKRRRVATKPPKRPDDALEWQERHSPTVEIAVEDPEGRRRVRRNLTRCRQSEAWRHNRLNGMQREAEREMELAWRLRTAGLGAAVSRFRLAPAGSANPDRAGVGAAAEATWQEWTALARQRRITVAVVLECLTEPKTLGEVERDHRLRRGQAFDQFAAGLDLWCELRGWTRPAAPGGELEVR